MTVTASESVRLLSSGTIATVFHIHRYDDGEGKMAIRYDGPEIVEYDHGGNAASYAVVDMGEIITVNAAGKPEPSGYFSMVAAQWASITGDPAPETAHRRVKVAERYRQAETGLQ